MFVSLPLASWWTKSIPDFAVTSSNRSSGPAATGGEAGSARPAAAVPLRDLLPHPGASRASASAGATHRMRLRGPLARLTVSHPKELRSPYLRPPARVRRPVSYTHLRAHETRHDLVCRLLLEKKKKPRPTYKSLSTQKN